MSSGWDQPLHTKPRILTTQGTMRRWRHYALLKSQQALKLSTLTGCCVLGKSESAGATRYARSPAPRNDACGALAVDLGR